MLFFFSFHIIPCLYLFGFNINCFQCLQPLSPFLFGVLCPPFFSSLFVPKAVVFKKQAGIIQTTWFSFAVTWYMSDLPSDNCLACSSFLLHFSLPPHIQWFALDVPCPFLENCYVLTSLKCDQNMHVNITKCYLVTKHWWRLLRLSIYFSCLFPKVSCMCF